MDTDAFLMSVRRFISHRGRPFEFLSDCGSNFKGGDTELREAFNSMSPDIAKELSTQKLKFKYNPPHASHFGGTWERKVKSVKQGLRAVLGDQSVTEPVLRLVFAEIAAILISKPLGYVTGDVVDIDPVTLNSLLIGRPDPSLPQVVYPEDELLGRKCWRHSQVISDQFWKNFTRRYLPFLQPRGKWTKDRKDLGVGDVVLIIDPQQIRAKWHTGRITDAISGSDGEVRTANVRVGNQDYLRPVSRLVKLPEIEDD